MYCQCIINSLCVLKKESLVLMYFSWRKVIFCIRDWRRVMPPCWCLMLPCLRLWYLHSLLYSCSRDTTTCNDVSTDSIVTVCSPFLCVHGPFEDSCCLILISRHHFSSIFSCDDANNEMYNFLPACCLHIVFCSFLLSLLRSITLSLVANSWHHLAESMASPLVPRIQCHWQPSVCWQPTFPRSQMNLPLPSNPLLPLHLTLLSLHPLLALVR